MKRYVQNKSSEKAPLWEISKDHDYGWTVTDGHIFCVFPKSEYHEVPAPEQWERCGPSSIVSLEEGGELQVDGWHVSRLPPGYRWAWDKQEDGTLCIERKVTE